MNLQPVDLAIVAGYIVVTIGLGFWVSKLSSGSLTNYFLAGNKLPWYVLGLSNASGMFDVGGTMWMVGLLVVYGLKSVLIPWLWPVFNQIFLMVFLAVWLRRSGKLTGAEWMTFRFGDSGGARASHLINVVFALIMVVGMLAYGFLGIGKLVAVRPATRVNHLVDVRAVGAVGVGEHAQRCRLEIAAVNGLIGTCVLAHEVALYWLVS